jgi:hypothetical protein
VEPGAATYFQLLSTPVHTPFHPLPVEQRQANNDKLKRAAELRIRIWDPVLDPVSRMGKNQDQGTGMNISGHFVYKVFPTFQKGWDFKVLYCTLQHVGFVNKKIPIVR